MTVFGITNNSEVRFGETYASEDYCYTEILWSSLSNEVQKRMLLHINSDDDECDTEIEQFPILIYRKNGHGVDLKECYISILECSPSQETLECIIQCINDGDFSYSVTPVLLSAREKIALLELIK